ncbi:MAG: hypothetical protein J6F30_06280 [Cellulosilyticum sp.]|nr:hypothetical protein [Cellulosilyticum sp.]
MSKYTTELRYICEVLAGLDESEGYNSVDDIIENSYDKVFDFDYPIFDEEYRPVLEKKIIRHFYTREIGDETVGLFKLHLSAKMNDIMDYYNQLYKSALIEFDPMTDIKYSLSGSESMSHSESHSASESSSTSESTYSSLSTSESTSESEMNSQSLWDMYQDTPQNQLTGVESLAYLTNATLDKSHGNSSRDTDSVIDSTGHGTLNQKKNGTKDNIGSSNDIKRYLEKYEGYRSNNPSKLLTDFRETFLNIDLMIIGELEKLFFQLW